LRANVVFNFSRKNELFTFKNEVRNPQDSLGLGCGSKQRGTAVVEGVAEVGNVFLETEKKTVKKVYFSKSTGFTGLFLGIYLEKARVGKDGRGSVFGRLTYTFVETRMTTLKRVKVEQTLINKVIRLSESGLTAEELEETHKNLRSLLGQVGRAGNFCVIEENLNRWQNHAKANLAHSGYSDRDIDVFIENVSRSMVIAPKMTLFAEKGLFPYMAMFSFSTKETNTTQQNNVLVGYRVRDREGYKWGLEDIDTLAACKLYQPDVYATINEEHNIPKAIVLDTFKANTHTCFEGKLPSTKFGVEGKRVPLTHPELGTWMSWSMVLALTDLAAFAV